MLVNQPNMAEDERLADMFTKNMSLDQPLPPPPPPQEPARIVYISQHYTHTAHITSQTAETPQAQLTTRPASEPSQREYHLAGTVLRNDGVDPSLLPTFQKLLFTHADESQRGRLVEMWRICPPNQQPDDLLFASDLQRRTIIEEAELLLKITRQKLAAGGLGPEQAWWQTVEQLCLDYMGERRPSAIPTVQDEDDTVMSLDGTTVPPLVPIQGYDGRWMGGAMETNHYMEPYMSTGYGAAAADVPRLTRYNQATDPVYNSQSRGLSYSQIEELENQYGRMVEM